MDLPVDTVKPELMPAALPQRTQPRPAPTGLRLHSLWRPSDDFLLSPNFVIGRTLLQLLHFLSPVMTGSLRGRSS